MASRHMESTSFRPLLVIDKSFAHAMKAARIEALSAQYTFLVPSAFYFEVFDEPSKVRATLAGIREFRRVHVPKMIESEKETGQPCIEFEALPLSVNPDVFRRDWNLGAEEQSVMRKIDSAVVTPLRKFWNDVIDVGVPGFDAETHRAVRYGDDATFLKICYSLCERRTILSAAEFLGVPHAAILDERWVSYRMFQAMLLQGLVLWRRYKTEKDKRSPKGMEHDLHDMEYLILGLHCGALATNDASTILCKATLGWRFRLLSPSGLLLSAESKF